MTKNKEAILNLLITMMRLDLVDKPKSYIEFMMWHRIIKNYGEQYGIKIETELA